MPPKMRLRRPRPAPEAAPAPPSLETLLRTAECAARASTIDDLADAVVAGVADILGASRCTLLKAAPELLMPLGTADRGPLLDAELQVAGAVMRTQEPRFVTQIAHRLAGPDEEAASEIEVSTLALPLVAGTDLVGVLVATWDGAAVAPSDGETEAARVIASIAGLAMERTLLGQQAAKLHEVDPLTGTGSRDSLIALLDVLRERGTLHSVVVLDVDSFREYNRRHGRAHADRLLTALAAMISRECRDGDALVRSGADEFALVLPGSPIEAGTATARRVVSAIADWGHEDGVTVSAGVACMTAEGSTFSAVRWTPWPRPRRPARAASRSTDHVLPSRPSARHATSPLAGETDALSPPPLKRAYAPVPRTTVHLPAPIV